MVLVDVGWCCDLTMLSDRTQGPAMDQVNSNKTCSEARVNDYGKRKNIGFLHGRNRHGP